jgi:hypothetical protein
VVATTVTVIFFVLLRRVVHRFFSVFTIVATMTEGADYKLSIPRFDGFYDHWSMMMENLLRSKEYWHLIENGVTTAPENATAEELQTAAASKLLDLKVKN